MTLRKPGRAASLARLALAGVVIAASPTLAYSQQGALPSPAPE